MRNASRPQSHKGDSKVVKHLLRWTLSLAPLLVSQKVGVEWVGDLGWSLCVKYPVLTFGRAPRPTFIESFFVVHRSEGLRSRILSVAAPFPWRIGAKSKASLSAHLGVCSSQQQADVMCTVKLCGTCCTNFMRGRLKNTSETCFLP